jgi:hypothetical protein
MRYHSQKVFKYRLSSLLGILLSWDEAWERENAGKVWSRGF